MRDRLDELDDVSVAVLTFADAASLTGHRAHLQLPFPLLSDPDLAIYRRFGLERAPLHAVYGLGNLRMYARLLRQGRRLKRPTEDTRQLGGDFVIDRDGRLSAAFRPSSPDRRPGIDELISAVAAAS